MNENNKLILLKNLRPFGNKYSLYDTIRDQLKNNGIYICSCRQPQSLYINSLFIYDLSLINIIGNPHMNSMELKILSITDSGGKNLMKWLSNFNPTVINDLDNIN